VVLASSDMKGACYVETKNLDGETNLKTKMAHKNLRSIYCEVDEFKHLKGHLNCE
jgi:phospholipid-transporting ATPase